MRMHYTGQRPAAGGRFTSAAGAVLLLGRRSVSGRTPRRHVAGGGVRRFRARSPIGPSGHLLVREGKPGAPIQQEVAPNLQGPRAGEENAWTIPRHRASPVLERTRGPLNSRVAPDPKGPRAGRKPSETFLLLKSVVPDTPPAVGRPPGYPRVRRPGLLAGAPRRRIPPSCSNQVDGDGRRDRAVQAARHAGDKAIWSKPSLSKNRRHLGAVMLLRGYDDRSLCRSGAGRSCVRRAGVYWASVALASGRSCKTGSVVGR